MAFVRGLPPLRAHDLEVNYQKLQNQTGICVVVTGLTVPLLHVKRYSGFGSVNMIFGD